MPYTNTEMQEWLNQGGSSTGMDFGDWMEEKKRAKRNKGLRPGQAISSTHSGRSWTDPNPEEPGPSGGSLTMTDLAGTKRYIPPDELAEIEKRGGSELAERAQYPYGMRTAANERRQVTMRRLQEEQTREEINKGSGGALDAITSGIRDMQRKYQGVFTRSDGSVGLKPPDDPMRAATIMGLSDDVARIWGIETLPPKERIMMFYSMGTQDIQQRLAEKAMEAKMLTAQAQMVRAQRPTQRRKPVSWKAGSEKSPEKEEILPRMDQLAKMNGVDVEGYAKQEDEKRPKTGWFGGREGESITPNNIHQELYDRMQVLMEDDPELTLNEAYMTAVDQFGIMGKQGQKGQQGQQEFQGLTGGVQSAMPSDVAEMTFTPWEKLSPEKRTALEKKGLTKASYTRMAQQRGVYR